MDSTFSAGGFEAFKGNALVKATSRSSSQMTNKSSTNNLFQKQPLRGDIFNFDAMWKGSINNLISCENITEDLIKESITELETAMTESKRMLVERDVEIERLRAEIENNKLQNGSKVDRDECERVSLALRESQKRALSLECELRETRQQHKLELMHASRDQNKQEAASVGGCTCQCGSACRALDDLSATRATYEQTRMKYDTLKRKVREFRRKAEHEHRTKMRQQQTQQKQQEMLMQEEKYSCVVQ